MAVEGRAVPTFINEIFQVKRVKDVVATLAVDSEELAAILEKELADMGIYAVLPNKFRNHMIDIVIFRLRNSPNVHQLLHKARIAARKRDSNRRKTGG